MLAQQPGFATADLSHIQCIGIGGSAAPVALIEAYGAKGIRLRQGWGMTETGPVGLLLSGEMALKKAGSCGLPPLYVQLKICDPEGREVPRGETGELLIKGPNVTPGYWNLPEANLRAFTSDGWLRSGDAARQDQDTENLGFEPTRFLHPLCAEHSPGDGESQAQRRRGR